MARPNEYYRLKERLTSLKDRRYYGPRQWLTRTGMSRYAQSILYLLVQARLVSGAPVDSGPESMARLYRHDNVQKSALVQLLQIDSTCRITYCLRECQM